MKTWQDQLSHQLLRHVLRLSTSARSVCLTSSGQPLAWADLRDPAEYYAICDTACTVSDRMLCFKLARPAAGPDGGLRASRGGAAWHNAVRHRRPQTQPGLRAMGRAAADTARRKATQPLCGPLGTRAVSGSGLWQPAPHRRSQLIIPNGRSASASAFLSVPFREIFRWTRVRVISSRRRGNSTVICGPNPGSCPSLLDSIFSRTSKAAAGAAGRLVESSYCLPMQTV
jgi:hypothetical protein